MIVMNENGSRCQHEEKIDEIVEFCKNNQIDTVLLSEANGKCRTRTLDSIISKMKALGRETRCYFEDRKAHKKQTETGFQEE